MEPGRDRISETGKRAIRSLGTTLPSGLLKLTELRSIIASGRDSFGIVRSVSDGSIFRFLLRDGIVKEARLNFPSRPETRYSRGEIDIFELALSASSNSYFCQQTALHLHGLADGAPGLIYVNSEQREKPRGAELTQDGNEDAASLRDTTRISTHGSPILDGNEDAASLRDTTRISTHGSPILAASSFPSQNPLKKALVAGCRDRQRWRQGPSFQKSSRGCSDFHP
jgi:hypothetical protein